MLASNYASALYDIATENGLQELFLSHLKDTQQIFKDVPKFYKFLCSTSIKNEEKIKLIDKTFKDFSPIYVNFLSVLVKNKRFKIFFDIKTEYRKIFNEHYNILHIDVYSATLLTDVQLENLKKSLLIGKFKGKNLILHNHVEKDLIGGVRILCNGESIDLSILNSLKKLKDSLERG